MWRVMATDFEDGKRKIVTSQDMGVRVPMEWADKADAEREFAFWFAGGRGNFRFRDAKLV